MDETRITELMGKLSISREEAIDIINYDKAVDKGEKTIHDLTAEQEKTAAKMRRADRKPFVPKLEKRERKPNEDKKAIISLILAAIEPNADKSVEILNPEREIVFYYSGTKYKITLSAPRK